MVHFDANAETTEIVALTSQIAKYWSIERRIKKLTSKLKSAFESPKQTIPHTTTSVFDFLTLDFKRRGNGLISAHGKFEGK